MVYIGKTELEEEIAQVLIQRIKSHDMTLERASEVARFILKALPEGTSNEDVAHVLEELDEHFIELSDIVALYLLRSKEERKDIVVHDITTLVKQNQMKEATDMIHQYFTDN